MMKSVQCPAIHSRRVMKLCSAHYHHTFMNLAPSTLRPTLCRFQSYHKKKPANSVSPYRTHVQQSSLHTEEIQRFLRDHTAISRDHLTPEIALRLITPACPLWSSPGEDCAVPDPFWAFYWPGGQALTRYLLDNPSVVRGRDVIDVGSGCGASAIAAAKCGASTVIANDICPVALEAIRVNAALNRVKLTVCDRNYIGTDDVTPDVVLLGDMFYDEDFTDLVTAWIRCLRRRGCAVYIGDPGRVYLKHHPLRDSLVQVYSTELPQSSKDENYGLTHGFVWVVR